MQEEHCAAIRLIKSISRLLAHHGPAGWCPSLSILYLSGGETITIGEEQRGIPQEQDNNIANRFASTLLLLVSYFAG